ncbi:hypothetical protein OS493_010671 [Desmophyllum pertusum]|uniref:Uncharacterized protein n=1 Tax=Desmophyllum pertusum TaxID=174260 RepID=A0A9W9ZR77_9CNID|nr:hypothetical protein OS493_010671 [Desmophyllum pertusum]
MASKNELAGDLLQYRNIEFASQVVRNDTTNEQQRRLTKRIIAARKSKEFKSSYDNRGRPLLADEFPELGLVLQSIFEGGESGIGGGIESHPRLTTEIMFRSRDNNLYMWQAREILLKVAPPQFAISLSSCYNYTDPYRENTFSAKRHHSGRNVNAKVSLKCPPRDSVSHKVVNLHWSTKAINLLLEKAETRAGANMVESRDAKSIICADIQPVQNPGKSWKPISYEDHTFDQSRAKAVVPMTHLFMDLKCDEADKRSNSHGKQEMLITRTGKPVTLIYIGISEPETTFRAMDEMFYLLTLPSLDTIFRNPDTGTLKHFFSFIVDNGHGEDPDSALTQMCMIITNALDERTALKDKYAGTSLWTPGNQEEQSVLQPIPDYVRWLNENGELHYLSFEKMEQLQKNVPELSVASDLFLPGKILDIYFRMEPDPSGPHHATTCLACLVTSGKR